MPRDSALQMASAVSKVGSFAEEEGPCFRHDVKHEWQAAGIQDLLLDQSELDIQDFSKLFELELVQLLLHVIRLLLSLYLLHRLALNWVELLLQLTLLLLALEFVHLFLLSELFQILLQSITLGLSFCWRRSMTMPGLRFQGTCTPGT